MTVSRTRLEKALPWILIIGSVIGLICSFIISLDKLKILENPSFQPNCDLNPIISCGSVMRSAQGSVFGFPNPWIGLVGFGILLAVGMGILAGARYARWFWITMNGAIGLGLVFAYWLLFESMYRIHALCPYCLTVDMVVITLFWYVTLYDLRTGKLPLPAGKIWRAGKRFVLAHHLDILLLWFLLLIAFILNHFWYYFGTRLF